MQPFSKPDCSSPMHFHDIGAFRQRGLVVLLRGAVGLYTGSDFVYLTHDGSVLILGVMSGPGLG